MDLQSEQESFDIECSDCGGILNPDPSRGPYKPRHLCDCEGFVTECSNCGGQLFGDLPCGCKGAESEPPFGKGMTTVHDDFGGTSFSKRSKGLSVPNALIIGTVEGEPVSQMFLKGQTDGFGVTTGRIIVSDDAESLKDEAMAVIDRVGAERLGKGQKIWKNNVCEAFGAGLFGGYTSFGAEWADADSCANCGKDFRINEEYSIIGYGMSKSKEPISYCLSCAAKKGFRPDEGKSSKSGYWKGKCLNCGLEDEDYDEVFNWNGQCKKCGENESYMRYSSRIYKRHDNCEISDLKVIEVVDNRVTARCDKCGLDHLLAGTSGEIVGAESFGAEPFTREMDCPESCIEIGMAYERAKGRCESCGEKDIQGAYDMNHDENDPEWIIVCADCHHYAIHGAESFEAQKGWSPRKPPRCSKCFKLGHKRNQGLCIPEKCGVCGGEEDKDKDRSSGLCGSCRRCARCGCTKNCPYLRNLIWGGIVGGAESFESYKVASPLGSYTVDELVSSKAGPQGSATYDEMVYDPVAQDRMSAEFNAKQRNIAKKSWDTLTNVETAVGTIGLVHMIGLGAILGGSWAILKGRKSNSKTDK